VAGPLFFDGFRVRPRERKEEQTIVTLGSIRFSNITITTRPKWGQGWEWPIVVDIERRTENSRLSRIRDISFSDMTIYTQGRIMVSGKPASLIENVSFSRVTLRIAGFENLAGAPKMSGGGAKFADGLPDYAETPAALSLANLKGLRIDGLNLFWPASSSDSPGRHAIYGDRLDDFAISGSSAPTSAPAISSLRLENTINAGPVNETGTNR